ncbi:hypothetical protein [Candidatus Magnetaquicoccus inordinatus]|uniref:hypothetical protein n=1 Tax=Candidatus Magnetaquicoccus inordinatus TaxID=2496818 RepID=UPI00102B9906|nr:hypothetical protein [Candidatus Magnetaquicoccus inordinatus]
MNNSLFRVEVLPFLGLFSALLVATLVGDLLLHALGLVWIGRYLGIPGTLLILLSLWYSLRKRKVVQYGSPQILLKIHENFTWLGALMVFIHAGVHFNAVLPWLATVAMMVNIISGLVGRYLLNRSRRYLAEREEIYRFHGLSQDAVQAKIFWDAVTYELMAKWREVHFPISFVFAVLALGHIISVFLFWEWP